MCKSVLNQRLLFILLSIRHNKMTQLMMIRIKLLDCTASATWSSLPSAFTRRSFSHAETNKHGDDNTAEDIDINWCWRDTNNTLHSVLFLKMRINDVWCLNIICCLSVVGGQMEAGVDQTFLLLKLFSAPSIVDVSDSVNDRISWNEPLSKAVIRNNET